MGKGSFRLASPEQLNNAFSELLYDRASLNLEKLNTALDTPGQFLAADAADTKKIKLLSYS